MPGFSFFSTGAAWERAFEEALRFLERPAGTLVLGPAIGEAGRAWIEDRYLSANNVRFGLRVQAWDEWVKACARESAIAAGRGFRPLDRVGLREHLRIVARTMADSGAFHHLQKIWNEEKFFAGLLDCVSEARAAGLDHETAITRAKDLLASGDETTRAAYEDFWNLLALYENLLQGNGGGLDDAALFRLAASGPAPREGLFLLGFDEVPLLATELLQRWASHVDVVVPLAIPRERIEAAFRETAGDADLPAELALRGLLTGYAGERRLLDVRDGEPGPRRRFLEAHTPSEEARAAAALGRAAFADFDELRFVAPGGYFDDRAVSRPFREELGLPENFCARNALAHPVSRLFFHVLEIKHKDYSLGHGLEVAKLLEFTTGKFGEVASLAHKAGVRKGLADWKRKAENLRGPEKAALQEFAAKLESIGRALPDEGTAEDFSRAVTRITEEIGIALLAKTAPGPAEERDAHAALSTVLRNVLKLVAMTRPQSRFLFPEWLAELRTTLEGSSVGETLSLFPKVQLYRYGEWLPPAGARTLTLALGLNSGAGPSPGFQFFLEEGARRRLSELLLPTNVQRGLGFLDAARRLTRQTGPTLLSWSAHDDGGGEAEPHWVTGALELERGAWPEMPREAPAEAYRAPDSVSVGNPGFDHFSASFFELYKQCPFRAFAERVLRLEDKVQESSLDVSRLEEGSFVHKVLELYYRDHGGREITDAAERERVLDLCVREAGARVRVEYYKGNENLFESQVARLRALLLNFLALDGEQYARFPFFSKVEVEKEVSGELEGGFRWQGKIDRVDYDEKNRRFLVTDYKIGASPPANAEVNELKRFQLQLYMDAVERERVGWEPIGGIYASVTSGERGTGLLRKEFASAKGVLMPGEVKYFKAGATSRALHDAEAFADLRARSRAEATRLAQLAAAGEFPVRPDDEETSCPRCPVRPACRVRDLRSPPLEPWPRPAPGALLGLLAAPAPRAPEPAREKRFNPEQADALERRGSLVFIEASAGTGKTTVIVERVRRFLEERVALEPSHLAVERFRAISFTEKSAKELAARAASSLLPDPRFGPRVAAQAQAQVSTIHGFCRKLIGDFPLEAGVSPLATMLDQKGADALRRETVEDFFLFPEEEAAAGLSLALSHFSRAKVETILLRLLEGRLLFRGEYDAFRAGGAGDKIFPEGGARDVLLLLLDLADRLGATYEKRKREAHVLDFNDLEALALKVLEHEHVRAHYRKQYELLLVDEFQDTNSLQRDIFEKIARPGRANLFVVGDAKQSIYRFRAADVSVFQGLRREAEAGGHLVTLGRNYRSRREIVEAANRITKAILPGAGADAPDFEAVDSPAIPEQAAGGRVCLVEYGEPDRKWDASERRTHEAKLVARLVRDLRKLNPDRTIAVLLRKVSGNEHYLRALTDAGISFRVGASKGFYGQSLVTDSIALLRVLFGAKNDLALLAVLRSPWVRMPDAQVLAIQRRGEAFVPLRDKLRETEASLLFEWEQLATHSSLAGVLERALAAYPQGRREHLQAVKLLSIVDALEAEARPRAEIVDLLSSWSGWDQENSADDDSIMPEPASKGTVQVMTVHASKGLEFDVTILADLCGRLVPDNFALRMVRGAGMVLKLESDDDNGPNAKQYREIGRRNSERDLAELKRLFYVAVTRAREEEYFFLPRSFEEQPPEKWNSCANFLRAADLRGVVEEIDGDEWAEPALKLVRTESAPADAPWPKVPVHSHFRTSSITQIGDFNTCPEFHRLKHIQRWDDRIVELWGKPKDAFRKQKVRRNVARDPESERVAKLLRKLGIERKERGIALHRVLERIQDPDQGLESAATWLREAYEAQGVPPDADTLAELVAVDIDRIRHFLTSPLGRTLFARDAEAFPEIPFQWKVGDVVLHGAIDRLIRKRDGSWLVVDYKSSIQEQSLDDYEFQVRSYMAAVRDREGAGTKVNGFLVDLFAARPIEVKSEPEDAMHQLRSELEKASTNYTPEGTKLNLVDRGVRGGEQCFSCPYSYHCEIGLSVLRSN